MLNFQHFNRNFMHQFDDEEEIFEPDQLDLNAMSIYQDSYASPSQTPPLSKGLSLQHVSFL